VRTAAEHAADVPLRAWRSWDALDLLGSVTLCPQHKSWSESLAEETVLGRRLAQRERTDFPAAGAWILEGGSAENSPERSGSPPRPDSPAQATNVLPPFLPPLTRLG
jgi:hypothetical protein